MGAQLAGNHTYRVLIKLHDPNHWVNFGVWRSIMILPLSSLLLVFLTQISTKPVLPRALSEAELGRLREALLSNSLYSGSIQNPGVNRGLVSVSNRMDL